VGTWHGWPATGRRFKSPMLVRIPIAPDGLMEAEIVYNDSADIFMQLGILPRQGSRQERVMQALYRVRGRLPGLRWACRLAWPAGEVTMIVGAIASTLILYNGVIDRPGSAREFVHLDVGWYLGLLGALGIVAGGAISQVRRGGVTRRPPGTF